MRQIAALLIALPLFAQEPAFEAVSIKPSAPLDGRGLRYGPYGGPGTKDPSLFTCDYCTLRSLILRAYDLKSYQLIAPGWSGSREGIFDLHAKVPEGATADQLPAMLRSTLTGRFKMLAHRETRSIPAYRLTIAKGGVKMKPFDPGLQTHETQGPAMGNDGFPMVPQGRESMTAVVRGVYKMRAAKQTIAQLVTMLTAQVAAPVSDATGLTGDYAFTLAWARNVDTVATNPDDDPPQNIFVALEQQLGLKLIQTKGPVEMLIVDHLERVPTEN